MRTSVQITLVVGAGVIALGAMGYSGSEYAHHNADGPLHAPGEPCAQLNKVEPGHFYHTEPYRCVPGPDGSLQWNPDHGAVSGNPYSGIVGSWVGHHRQLDISAQGVAMFDGLDPLKCPDCALAGMPHYQIVVQLSPGSYQSHGQTFKYAGVVSISTDSDWIPVGEGVALESRPGTNGGRIIVATTADPKQYIEPDLPYCDTVAGHNDDCGA